MSTAAERAADLIDEADDITCERTGSVAAAGADIIAALMADPDLLVDLAIEAGGLERLPLVGFSGGYGRIALADNTEEAVALAWRRQELPDGPFALYRRASRPTGEDRP